MLLDNPIGSFQGPTCCRENAKIKILENAAFFFFFTFHFNQTAQISSSDCSHLEAMQCLVINQDGLL